jgi:hypothetical protein
MDIKKICYRKRYYLLIGVSVLVNNNVPTVYHIEEALGALPASFDKNDLVLGAISLEGWLKYTKKRKQEVRFLLFNTDRGGAFTNSGFSLHSFQKESFQDKF